jgi:hypothetical protein
MLRRWRHVLARSFRRREQQEHPSWVDDLQRQGTPPGILLVEGLPSISVFFLAAKTRKAHWSTNTADRTVAKALRSEKLRKAAWMVIELSRAIKKLEN